MAIYKLGEIAKNIAILKKPNYPQYILNTSDLLFGKFSPKIINKNIKGQFKKTVRKGEIVFSEIRPTNGRWGLVNEKNSWLLSTKFMIIKPKTNVLSKFLYFLLTKKINNEIGEIAKNRSGTFPQVTFNSISNIKINLPSLKTQKQIIDIIEPLEKIIYKNNKIVKKIEYIIMNLPIKKTLEEDIFKKITTGKLNVNAINENGKYNFYSCSSKIKKTNFNSFKGRYILLSGNGEIYSWWYEGEFDLYQRVYALTEKRSFFTTFLSVKKGLDKIRKRSNGAVIKFIKLSDIKTIKMLNDNYENILKKMFIFQKKLEFLNEKIIILKNKLLNLLVK